jgi:hypothetical protein
MLISIAELQDQFMELCAPKTFRTSLWIPGAESLTIWGCHQPTTSFWGVG